MVFGKVPDVGKSISGFILGFILVTVVVALLPMALSTLSSLGDVFNESALAPLFANDLIWYLLAGMTALGVGWVFLTGKKLFN